MKRTLLPTAIIMPFAAFGNSYIEIESPILHIIDGTPRVNVLKIARFRNALRKLHFMIAQIMYDGRLCTIKDLCAVEEDANHDAEKLRLAFEEAIKLFSDLAVPYMKDAEGSEDIIRSLVKQWSLQRKREQSLLVKWSELTGSAQVVFYKNITSVKALNDFIEDLELFLGDFMTSCKKSLEQLKKANKQS